MSTSTPTSRAYMDLPCLAVLALLSSCEHGVPRYVGSTGTRSTSVVLTPDSGVQTLDAATLAVDAGTDVASSQGGAPAAPDGADGMLEQQIERNLRQDPLVPADSVEVDVRNGIATIRGRVPSWQAYKAVMDDVANAQPFRIVNELKVVASGE